MPSNNKKANNKQVERPKTRKELRKDKRLQKKANRVHYHKKKKELKIEYRARLKLKKSGKIPEKCTKAKNKEEDEILEKNLFHASDTDDEIASDFELSDEEMEEKFKNKRYRYVLS